MMYKYVKFPWQCAPALPPPMLCSITRKLAHGDCFTLFAACFDSPDEMPCRLCSLP